MKKKKHNCLFEFLSLPLPQDQLKCKYKNKSISKHITQIKFITTFTIKSFGFYMLSIIPLYFLRNEAEEHGVFVGVTLFLFVLIETHPLTIAL